jgi:hypothetical protein
MVLTWLKFVYADTSDIPWLDPNMLHFLLGSTVAVLAIWNSKTILSLIPQITFCTSMSLQMDPVLFWEGYLMRHYIETKPRKKCQTSVFHDLLPLFATVPWQAVLDDISPIYQKKNYQKWIRWHCKFLLSELLKTFLTKYGKFLNMID